MVKRIKPLPGRPEIGVVDGEGYVLTDAASALDLIGEGMKDGVGNVIIKRENIHPDFFDLRTGLAGEALQKFSTYRCRLAITGDFSAYDSRSLQDFIRESNRYGRVIFAPTEEEAARILIGKEGR